MSQIYQEQVTSNYAHEVNPDLSKLSDVVSGLTQRAKELSEGLQSQARDTYSKQIEINQTNAVSSMYEEHKTNPEAFSKKYDELVQKTSDSIVDSEVRKKYLVDSVLAKDSYVSQIKKNKRIQDDKMAFDTNYMTVSNNSEKIGSLFGKMVFATPEENLEANIVNFMNLSNESSVALNSKDSSGLPLFTAHQRIAFDKATRKAMLGGLANSFASSTNGDRVKHYELLKKNNVKVIVGKDDDGNVVEKNLKDILSEDDYLSYKDHIEKIFEKNKELRDLSMGLDSNIDTMSKSIAMQQATDTLDAMKKVLPEIYDKKGKQVSPTRDGAYKSFDFADAVLNAKNQGLLTEKQYRDYMGLATSRILHSVNAFKDRDPNDFGGRAIEIGMGYMKRQLGNTQLDDRSKAAGYRMLYRAIQKKGEGVDDFFVNHQKVKAAVDSVVRALEIQRNPNLLSVNAERVLTGSGLIDWMRDINDPKNEVYPKEFQDREFNDGHVYRVYKDSNGDFSINSNRILLR